ncbi:MAG: YeeE/YedE family protein [Gammaproteobacteria bacterium]|nr:YeeE/YedE family protein [Gammaproteobacteria bacterium]
MKQTSLFAVLVSGVLFGFGLALATMIRPEVVLSFLRFQDFGLLAVLGGAASVTAVAYQLGPKLLRKPLFEASFGKHAAAMNSQTLGGAALFGIGWGISGVCPGPAIAGLGTGNWPLLFALFGLFCGAYVQGWWASRPAAGVPAPL